MKKITCIFGFLLLFTCLFAVSISAQKRKPKTASTTAKTASVKTLQIRRGAERIAIQIKNLSRFLYILGGTVRGIEAVDVAAQRGEASRTTMEQNNRNKGTIVLAIRNFRQSFDELEADFRFTPNLKPFYPAIIGVAETSAIAEEEAADGRFDVAGRNLLEVLNKLTDALLKMK